MIIGLDEDNSSAGSLRQPLLYLPGLDGTGRLLHRQTALLESYQVRCVSYPQDQLTTYELLADMAEQHLEAACAGQPGVVVAESFGGAVGLLLTLARPDLVERLVLVNTFAYFPARWRIHLAAALGKFMPAKPIEPTPRALRDLFFFSADIPAPERAAWWERTRDVPMRGFGFRLSLIPALDLRPRLSEITIPTLVIAAPNDRVVPASAGKELAKLLPRARLIEPRVGHVALMHPMITGAQLLADPTYGGPAGAAPTAATS